MLLLVIWDNAGAVPTPYDRIPVAIVTEDYNGQGLLWDFQLAEHFANNTNRRGFLAAVLDFCHSGGFVNELSGLSGLRGVYIAAACDWDEYSFGVFGQTFMRESKTHTLHKAFETAKVAVLPRQTPQEAPGGSLGTLTLYYLDGDRAVLFSADEQPPRPDFWRDITTARDALVNRPAGQWPKETVGAYFGDGTKKFDDGTPVNGSAMRSILLGAIDAVYLDFEFKDTSLLFLYLNDHGVSTDVVKSRYREGRYEYEVTTSLYRNVDDGGTEYGIWNVRHRVPDRDRSHYKNIRPPKEGWDMRITPDGWMEWYSTNPADPNTWLESGVNYPFGYEYPVPPQKVEWQDWVWQNWSGQSALNDFGMPDGSEWGRGHVVYGENRLNVPDPRQWPGWDNGGDGWVLAPAWAIPEPATLLLFGTGLSVVLGFARGRRRT